MKLETAYYTSQLVVAVAVVLSLIALTTQISQNTAALQHEVITATSDESARHNMSLTSPDLAAVWAKSLTTPESLQLSEIVQLDGYMISLLITHQGEFRQYEQGTMDAATWQTRIVSITSNLSGRWHRHWWEQNRDYVQPTFVQHVDKILQDPQYSFPLETYYQSLQLVDTSATGDTP